MSEQMKRITRSHKPTTEEEDDRQVLIDKLPSNNSTICAIDDAHSYHDSVDKLDRLGSDPKIDAFDVHSMPNSMKKLNLMNQYDTEEECERLAFETKLMKKRMAYMEQREM